MATSDVIASLILFFFFCSLLSVPWLSFHFTWRSIISAVQATSLSIQQSTQTKILQPFEAQSSTN
jgi:hypothetical protein